MGATATKKCEYCDKVGLPILPLRYAIAPQGAGAPKSTTLTTALGDKAAHYTRRLVRSGYVYLFDKARDTWECYFVTADSYFFRIDHRPGVTPILPKKPFDCPDEAHRAIASCIMIPNAKAATKVWIGFSDVRWTEDVLNKHKDPAYRDRHMRVIDVQSTMSGPDAKHFFAIKEVAKKVAEYQLSDSKLKEVFAWTPFSVNPRQNKATRLVEECEKLKPGKGLAVTLDDPVGLAQELALLMYRNAQLFKENEDRNRKLTIYGVIGQMEVAIKDQAQRNEMQAGEELANDQLAQPDIGMLFPSYRDNRLKQIEKVRSCTLPELDRAATYEWNKYKAKYKHKEADDWQASFEEQLATYDADFIAPLAIAHAQWMQSASMANYFDCNYDPQNIHTGVVYTAVFNQCIATTGDKKACHDLYEKWLAGSVQDHKNLLLGAATLNNNELRAQVQAAVSGGVGWAGLPWDKVVEAHDKATAKLMEGQADELGRLIGLISGPIASQLRKAANSQKVYEGLVALGAATRHPIVAVTLTGGKKAFRTRLIKEVLELGGLDVKAIGKHRMNKAIADELKRQQIVGVNLQGTQTKRWLLMVDPAEVRGMPQGLAPQAQAQWLAKTINTPEHIDLLNLTKHRARVANWVGVNRGAVPLAFGMLGVLANTVAFTSMLEDDAKVLQHTKNESLTRIVLQGTQLIGAVAGSIETALSRLPAMVSRIAAGATKAIGAFFGFVGKLFGTAGSIFMGLVDLWRADQERREGNYSAGIAYLVSGVLGIAATIFLFIGWTGVGLFVVALAILWAFVMNMLVDNKVQDWLERCVFGILDSKRYPKLDVEMKELQVATS
jgi:hypothetical protein